MLRLYPFEFYPAPRSFIEPHYIVRHGPHDITKLTRNVPLRNVAKGGPLLIPLARSHVLALIISGYFLDFADIRVVQTGLRREFVRHMNDITLHFDRFHAVLALFAGFFPFTGQVRGKRLRGHINQHALEDYWVILDVALVQISFERQHNLVVIKVLGIVHSRHRETLRIESDSLGNRVYGNLADARIPMFEPRYRFEQILVIVERQPGSSARQERVRYPSMFRAY